MIRITLGFIGLIALTAGWYAAQVATLDWLQPMSLNTNLSAVQRPVHPEMPLQIALQGYGAELGRVELFRSDAQTASAEEQVPARAVSDGARPGAWKCPMGCVPDSDYRLVIEAISPRPSFPLPGSGARHASNIDLRPCQRRGLTSLRVFFDLVGAKPYPSPGPSRSNPFRLR